MRANSTTTIQGKSALLVPYAAKHVPLYHSWMESDELREATASERLTLEEEMENQKSWAEDEAKLTFIICDSTRPGNPPVGDVNLFFKERSPPSFCDADDADDAGADGGIEKKPSRPSTSYLHETTEVEVMIADPLSRGKGIAREAVAMCLWWAAASKQQPSTPPLRLRLATAKIARKNRASLALFRGCLGFALVGGSDYFEEDHLELELFGCKNEGEEEEMLIPVLAKVGEYAVVREVASPEDAAAC